MRHDTEHQDPRRQHDEKERSQNDLSRSDEEQRSREDSGSTEVPTRRAPTHDETPDARVEGRPQPGPRGTQAPMPPTHGADAGSRADRPTDQPMGSGQQARPMDQPMGSGQSGRPTDQPMGSGPRPMDQPMSGPMDQRAGQQARPADQPMGPGQAGGPADQSMSAGQQVRPGTQPMGPGEPGRPMAPGQPGGSGMTQPHAGLVPPTEADATVPPGEASVARPTTGPDAGDRAADLGPRSTDRIAPEVGETDRGGRRAGEPGKMIQSDEASRLRGEWQRVQATFVDNPQDAVRGADELVTEVIRALQNSMAERHKALRKSSQDTEELRQSLHQYRALLDQLLDA